MSSDSTSDVPFAEHRQSIFGGVYRLLSKIDRTRLTAAYWVADEIDDQYLLIEFLNRNVDDQADAITPEIWQSSGAPSLADFLQIVEKLSRLRHPNIEPVLQFFEDNGTGYAVVQSHIAKSLADEIDRGVFFHQPPEIQTAAQGLVDAVTYCTAMRIEDVDLSPDSISIDDDGNPMISIRHFLEDMLDAKEDGQASDLAYGASQCIYAMMTGVIPEARHVRKHMVASGKADPVLKTVEMDLPYPIGMRKSVDIALSGTAMDQTAVLNWTRAFGSEKQSETPAPVAEKPKRKRAGGVFGALAGAGVLTAAVFALIEFKDDLLGSVGDAGSAPIVEVSTPQGAQEIETVTVAPEDRPEPAVSEGSDVDTQEPQVTEASEVSEPQVAAAPEAQDSETPASPNEQNAPEVSPSDDPAPEQPARRQVSAADLEAVLKDLAGGSNSAGQAAPATPVVEPAAPASDVAIAETSPPEPAEEQVALAAPASEAQEEAPKGPASPQQPALQIIKTFATDTVTGITWGFSDRVGYEIVAQDGEAAFLRLNSLDNHFSFVTKNPWYARNSEIRRFGEKEVDQEFSLQNALNSHFANTDQTSPLVDAMVSYDGSPPEAVKVDIPVQAARAFGPIRVAQRNVGGKWKLVVDQVQDPSTGVREGDQVMSVVGVEASLKTIVQLISIVEDEKVRGQTSMDVSVRRGQDSVLTVRLDLGDL